MDEWEARVAAVWAEADGLTDDAVLQKIDALVAERADTAEALLEAAGVRDYLGRESEAEPLYRAALALGLTGDREAQATIQLASTLRNLGQVDESITLLQQRLEEHPDDAWAAPALAFLSLALVSGGQPVAAASVALTALAGYLPAYSRSVKAYAAEL
jgi:tetratricopeptide (TPR) repeat protein